MFSDTCLQTRRQTWPDPDTAMADLGIVIVSYNTRDLLRACLRSVYASTGGLAIEVCVVDNASQDDSAGMVAAKFPQAKLITNTENVGYSRANNQGLRALGLAGQMTDAPAFALLLNPDTEVPPDGLSAMLRFMGKHADAGVAGPKLVLPDGSLDLACRRSLPTPKISAYRLLGLSRLFPRSRRFGLYNLTCLDPDKVAEVGSVVGAFMLVRREAVVQAGLMDEGFFMYGEDLDWAYRIAQAGWKVYYNPAVTVLHVKRAASRHSPRAQIEFFRAMEIFYRKHYAQETPRLLHVLIVSAVWLRTTFERLRHAWAGGGDRS